MIRLATLQVSPPGIELARPLSASGARVHLRMQQIPNLAIEVRRVGTLKQHRQIVTVRPVRLAPEVHADAVVKRRPRQGVRDRHADVVRFLGTDQIARLEDRAPVLTGISQLDEPAGPDTVLLQEMGPFANLVERGPLLHGIQHVLRAGLDAHPDLLATRLRQGLDRARRHEVDAGLHRERYGGTAGPYRGRERLDPPGRDAEDVVREPHVVGRHRPPQLRELFCHVRRGALRVAPAENRLRAPVAGVRTAARRADVPGEPAVRRRPGNPVALNVDQIPRGERQGVQIAIEGRAGVRRIDVRTATGGNGQPGTCRDRHQDCRPTGW